MASIALPGTVLPSTAAPPPAIAAAPRHSTLAESPRPKGPDTPAVPAAAPVASVTAAAKPAVSPAVNFLAGGIGGCVGAIITCPLEVVKTRMQSSFHTQLPANRFFFADGVAPLSGTTGLIRQIYHQEGFKAFWKGIGPTLTGVIPARAIYFATYNEAKKALTALHGQESSRVYMGSAVAAGVATTISTSPIWLIKTRMQLQSSRTAPMYRNSWDCFVKIVRHEGFFTLYRGLSASLIGISEGTIQWLIYEKLKKVQAARRLDHDRETRTPAAAAAATASKSWTEWLEYFGCAATAKLTAATLTYPHEVIRTRMRESPAAGTTAYKYNGLLQTARTIVAEEGAMALYGGMGVHLLRVVPNSAIMFLCYEGVVHVAQKWQHAEAVAAADE
ncbi:Pyrimidine nucleotide transporter, mitochondrial [Blastocladiella emersonii ATCC 22665]|nr:Pyrimidine nucleotide transporter, mitochondrial [Blastocladiella emersonii ATCC 22665]